MLNPARRARIASARALLAVAAAHPTPATVVVRVGAARISAGVRERRGVRGLATLAPPPTTPSPAAASTATSHPLQKPMFNKILIANRGEIACRVIRTARRLGIKTVAVYSEADTGALHVEMADEAYLLGPAPSSESYLKMDKIIEIAKRSGAQAIHPGYGFLSENASFAERLAEEGIEFIGPPASAIRSMGSKSESKDIMLAAKVPCVPGYHGSSQSPSHLLSEAQRIGFPVLIKAVLGGGGKGMRVVHSPEEFDQALESARREAQKSFGDERVLVERFVREPRHVEVQVFADKLGNVVHLHERDCSVQRRHQKVIEEAPAPGLSEELRAELGKKAVDAARAVGYVGAGTVEFIMDNKTKEFFFMEMNTRLQVEHPVTEMITQTDLVEWQLLAASGNTLPLAQAEILRVGHAFEARVYAENPRNNYLPDSGTLVHHRPPMADGEIVRVETGVRKGDEVSTFYDPMISKLVVHGSDRTEALRLLRKALGEYEVVGMHTNVDFLSSLASHEAFIAGEVDTSFIDRYHDTLFPPLPSPSPLVLAQAALYIVLRSLPAPAPTTSPWTALASVRLNSDLSTRTITLSGPDGLTATVTLVSTSSYPKQTWDFWVSSPSGTEPTVFRGVTASLEGPSTLKAELGDTIVRASIVSQPPLGVAEERLSVFCQGVKTSLTLPAPRWLAEQKATLGPAEGSVVALMPSKVIAVKVKEGDEVEMGQAVVVLESMKTETVLRAGKKGRVEKVLCQDGDMVAEGKELVRFVEEESGNS